jgi:arylsulfatase A-like enzyme
VRQVNECVPAVDESVGRVIAALRESGQYENTLVIYSADQGFAMGEHGGRSKLAPYDAHYRSPLIVAMPSRFPQGRVCQTPVNAPDLVATFLAMTGLQPPWDMHGRDITPLLEQPDREWPHPCLYTHTGQKYGSDVATTVRNNPQDAAHGGVPFYAAVVSGQKKLIRYLADGTEELYDLKADPEELHNLAADDAQWPAMEKLRAQLTEELGRTGGPQ